MFKTVTEQQNSQTPHKQSVIRERLRLLQNNKTLKQFFRRTFRYKGLRLLQNNKTLKLSG